MTKKHHEARIQAMNDSYAARNRAINREFWRLYHTQPENMRSNGRIQYALAILEAKLFMSQTWIFKLVNRYPALSKKEIEQIEQANQ